MAVTRADAKKVLTEYAGVGAAEADRLVKAVVDAAETEALELLGGQEPVPSSILDARALMLRYICQKAGRMLKPRELEVLLRLPTTTAQQVIKRMNATYAQAVDRYLKEIVKNTSTISETGDAEAGFRYEIYFDDPSALEFSYQLLQRKGLTHDVKVRRASQTLDLPRQINGKNPLPELGLDIPK